jgi:hypothetical protein
LIKKRIVLIAGVLLACSARLAFADGFNMTINSSPQGRTFTVDGGAAKITAPATYTWTSGSVHVIQWDTPQNVGSGSYNFTKWADGPVDNPRMIVMPGVDSSLTGTFTAQGSPSVALKFVPLSPCRVIDTRAGQFTTGSFGPPSLATNEARAFALPQGRCAIPTTAQAYVLNVTVVPQRSLGYITLWPTGQTQPVVSTLNSPDGGIVANMAVVPAGTSGSINVYTTDPTDVVVDVMGYFDASTGINSYAFYTTTPCRMVDTRYPTGPFGGPAMFGGQSRDFLVLNGSCALPVTASSLSMNATVVPSGTLGYLTLWPTGTVQPYASTLNSPAGRILANAAIITPGINGGVSAYVTNPTDLILDVNGYFAAAGSANNLTFYPVTPCRVVDTRNAAGTFGGPVMTANSTRSVPVVSSGCSIPSGAAAYSLNVTVVPQESLGYLTIWPTGQIQPVVSTLNSLDGRIVANAAIVPADANGSINVFVTNRTHVIIDVNGYFAAPPQ